MMQRLLRALATLLILAVIASVAHAGARLTWRVNGLDAAPLPPAPAPVAASAPLDIGPVLALAPFGDRAAAALPVPQAPADRPDADWLAGLTLQGIITAIPARRSQAILDVGGEGVRTVGVGDTPVRGATVIAVRRDGVVFSAGGEEVLLGFTSDADRRAAAIERQRSTIPEKFRGTTAGPAGHPARGSTAAVIDHYRRRIAENPQTVLDGFGVRLTPRGYEVGPDPSIGVTRAGLRPGDVIAAVNGEAVGDIEADRRLYEKIAAAGHARVEILRNGRRVILSFPLK